MTAALLAILENSGSKSGKFGGYFERDGNAARVRDSQQSFTGKMLILALNKVQVGRGTTELSWRLRDYEDKPCLLPEELLFEVCEDHSSRRTCSPVSIVLAFSFHALA